LKPVAPKRILVVKLSSLGDVVHAMPAVQDLRRAFPGVQIDWVVERAFAPLVQRCEGVNQVIACELRQWRKAPLAAHTRHAWNAFRSELQAQRYDAIIDLQGLSKSALVSWLARTSPAGRRYGLANQTQGSSFEAPARWVADVAIEIEPHVHAVQRSRILCAAGLGYALEGAPRFGLQPGQQAATPLPHPVQGNNSFGPRKPLVALVHGSSRADKQWPLANWIALGQQLNHAGFAVALAHGSAQEKADSEKIATALSDAWVWPSMALDAVTDTMAKCAGVIGVDSGLSHIAVALDVPHVQIYNFDTAWRTGPEVLAGTDAATAPSGVSRQTSVLGQPCPTVEAVWQAWESLATPVLCQ
jgi:heptosyltransferase I